MNVHYFQHVPFEGLGSIEQWMQSKSVRLSATKLYEEISFPNVHDIDWLIVMGGPMSINDEQAYPWLKAEKKFIAEAVENGKIVLGICLGAQLIASALGSSVFPNREREIGWFPVTCLAQKGSLGLKNIFPGHMEVFHWHGETFDLPAHAVHLARSEGCENQAFCMGEHVLGLQFHLEVMPESVVVLTEQCKSDLIAGRYVQSATEMVSAPSKFHQINAIMNSLLDYWYQLEPKEG
jgi:GMP synthase-like glutamine amidotransferase